MEISTQTEHGTCNVTLRGQFTFTDNPEFRLVMERLRDPEIKQLVLHMEHVDFVDSAALGMLLLAHDEAIKNSKPLLLYGVTGQVRRIFEMARFEQFFKF